MTIRLWTRKTLGVVALLVGGLAGLSPQSVLAQTPPAQTVPAVAISSGNSFSRVLVEGNQRIETATILNYAAIKPGKPVTPGQIDGAYRRLTASGLFEDVTITPRGNRLVIKVREYPTINKISFERNKRIKDEKLATLISSKPRHTYSPALAEADAAAIVAAYRQQGRFAAQVTPVIIRRSDNRVDLVFEIFEGKVVEIQRVSFVGNRHFSDRRLRRVLATKQAGLLHAFVKNDVFIADKIGLDKQLLRDFYLSRGFIDFQILSVDSEVARRRNGFFITFKVQEGQPYKFGKITTTSSLSEIDPDAYQAMIRFKPGVTYSPNLVDKAVSRMEALATQKGLNFIRVTPKVTRNDANRTLDIDFVIGKGPRKFVERIDIEGNTTTLDRVIRRQFTTVEGDPFNPREIRAAAARIRALGFFSKTSVTTRPGSAPDRVIVDVKVKDQPTGSLSFGLSYGVSTGLGGVISLSESNFLGRGQFVKADLGGGTGNRNYGLSFSDPAFLGRNVKLDMNIYRNTTTQRFAYYDTSRSGFSPKFGFPVSENGRLGLSYVRSSTTLSNISTSSSQIVRNDKGTRTVSAIGVDYRFDTRTTGINPNAGVLISLSQELAGLGGQARFSKTTALVGARTSILNEEVGLSLQLEGGYLKDFSGTSHISDRFFLGSNIMRGYKPNGIGPRDLVATNNDALGGNMYAVARAEANFPLGLPQEYGITGGAFLDVGSLWGLDNLNGGLTGTNPVTTAGFKLRSVLGFSIFWKTAVGPLRFNFTRVLSGPSYDQPEKFSLTIGSRF